MFLRLSTQTNNDSLGFRVVFGPDPFKLIQVMRPQNGPITGQIVKVIHDDSYKQVDDLKATQVALEMLQCLGSYTGMSQLKPGGASQGKHRACRS